MRERGGGSSQFLETSKATADGSGGADGGWRQAPLRNRKLQSARTGKQKGAFGQTAAGDLDGGDADSYDGGGDGGGWQQPSATNPEGMMRAGACNSAAQGSSEVLNIMHEGVVHEFITGSSKSQPAQAT